MERDIALFAASPKSSVGKSAGGRFVELWCAAGSPQSMQVGGWKVRVSSEWEPNYFDGLLPAVDYDVRGLKERHTRNGAGIAMVGCRKNTNREPIESHYPPELIVRPVTTVLNVENDHTLAVSLRDPLHHSDLAADFTAPLAELLGLAGGLSKLGFGGLTGSDESKRRGHKLYLMEPYDPHKTPVIFVHGLLSTPLAWANVTNELWGNAEFRRRFQIWHYHYPTSAPFLYSAKLFRQQLDEVRSQLDPKGEHPASAQIDIVAHSMGGLLTRTLITDSGENIWKSVFRVPPNTLRGSAEDRREVNDILHWKARREVRNVIFIAVPHRGSKMSREFVGRVGDALAHLPSRFTSMYARLNRDNPDALQPAFRYALSHGTLTSIDTLSPRHPLLEPLNRLPFSPWVNTYSIIGNRGKRGPLENSSDGVVAYASSHLDSALSELIVPTGHSAYDNPAAIAEILRILNARKRE
jgi:pimeloyl-ACP methyl ester carboxylesterase